MQAVAPDEEESALQCLEAVACVASWGAGLLARLPVQPVAAELGIRLSVQTVAAELGVRLSVQTVAAELGVRLSVQTVAVELGVRLSVQTVAVELGVRLSVPIAVELGVRLSVQGGSGGCVGMVYSVSVSLMGALSGQSHHPYSALSECTQETSEWLE